MDLLFTYRVHSTPASIYYIPNFISEQEESHIMKNVYSVPKPKWTTLSKRRLQDYGGVPHEKGMIPETIPNWLQIYMKKISSLDPFEGRAPNQVLVNEYLPGQGIMPHTDGPLFFAAIATITCGSHTVLQFSESDEKRTPVCDILLERYSLVIVTDDMYTKYLHSISERNSDTLTERCVNLPYCGRKYSVDDSLQRSTRISITIRNVPKVLKIKMW